MDKNIVLNNAPWELLKIALANAALFLFVGITLGSADLFFKTGNNNGLLIHLLLSPVYYVMLSLFYLITSLFIFYLIKNVYLKDILWQKVILTYLCVFINTFALYFFIKLNFDFSFNEINQKSGLFGFMLVFFTFMSTWSLIHFNKSVRLKRLLSVSEKELTFWKESLDKKEYFG